MSTTDNDIIIELKHLVAENQSLLEQLEEHKFIIDARDREIQDLKYKVAETNELRSILDNQLTELGILQDYIDQLLRQAAGAANREMDLEKQLGDAVSTEHQLTDLKRQYIYLQTQLTDLQARSQELNSRNLLLQQQTSHIAELESLLANARIEINEWKRKAGLMR